MTALPKPEPKPRVRKRLARGKRPRKVRKTPRAKIARECDKLWSALVRRQGSCEVCGGTNVLQAAHGFSRRYRGTRWVLLNGFCLCRGCHVKYTYDPLGWDAYIRGMWGETVYDELREAARFNGMPSDMEGVLYKLRLEESRDAR